ncbi:MAG: guanylate kinase [Calditrichia bacterium]
MSGKIAVFSAPSGGGKTTICKEILKRHKNAMLSVSATTRPPRDHEQHGREYYFLSEEEFMRKVKSGDFIEFEQVHGYWYGTLKSEFVKVEKNKDAILLFDIDVNGALNIKKVRPDSILIFILPPSREALIERLKNRKTESDEIIRKRLERLPYEYEQRHKFDHIIVNDDLEESVKQVEEILGLTHETDN